MKINGAAVIETFSVLQELAGKTAKEHGFRTETERVQESGDIESIRRLQANALMLMVSELVEAHDEIRHGRAANEAYYSGDSTPPKPEGVPSELADAVIRIVEFSDAWDIDLGRAIIEKMVYNDTREYMHGKKF